MKLRIPALLLAVAMFACAPTIKGAARSASHAAVDESVEELTSEESKKEFAEASQDPKVEFATKEFTDHIASSLLQTLASEDENVKAVARTFVSAAVDQLMKELSAPQNRARVGQLGGAFTQAAVAQLAAGLRSELGPALAEVMRRDLTPGMAEALGTALQPALATTAQNLAHNAVLGANAGVGEAWGDGPLGDVQGVADTVTSWTWLIVIGLALLTLMVIAFAVMVVARAARARAEVARLESATLLLATALRSEQTSSETNQLVTLVQDALTRRPEPSPGRLRRALHLG